MRSSSNSGGREGTSGDTKAENKKCNDSRGGSKRKLYVVGTGPGSVLHMSERAREVLAEVECIAGYTTYLELVQDLVKGKKVISTGMMKEIDRVEQAIDMAMNHMNCALISGGDPGIYAMAGLVFELCQKRQIQIVRNSCETKGNESALEIEVVPGIPALAAGAALAGAPLTHDFASVSLSDLLTPWESIEKRIEYAAMADFVIVIYNPKSKKRDWQLKRAQELILKHRAGTTPVAVVTGAMRENQSVTFTDLALLHDADIGMQTVLFIGSSASVRYLDFLFTPRGYTKKYGG